MGLLRWIRKLMAKIDAVQEKVNAWVDDRDAKLGPIVKAAIDKGQVKLNKHIDDVQGKVETRLDKIEEFISRFVETEGK